MHSDSVFFTNRQYNYVNKKHFKEAPFADILDYRSFENVKNYYSKNEGMITFVGGTLYTPTLPKEKRDFYDDSKLLYENKVSTIWLIYLP
jgi:hypothetical protein